MPTIRTALTTAAVAALTAAVVAAPPAAAATVGDTTRAAPRAAAVTSLDVSFTVRNVNRSALKCASDGKTYTIRGHLVGPATLLDDARVPLATTYLHGLSFGQFFWRFTGTPGYDYSANQARNGQVSLVIDRLGYRFSDQPNGYQVCAGSRADMAHQIVTQLKAGNYRAEGRETPPAADAVVLAGHSYGAQIAALEAHSFGDIDGLIQIGYADRVQSQLLRDNAKYTANLCAQGGVPRKRTYAPLGPVSGAPAALYNSATPRVKQQTLKLLTLDPCGDTASFSAATKRNLQRNDDIEVPVLVVAGGADKLFPKPAGPDQAKLFTGSKDVTAVVLPATAHAFTFERTRLTLASKIDRWLDLRFR